VCACVCMCVCGGLQVCGFVSAVLLGGCHFAGYCMGVRVKSPQWVVDV
jgi:hypothetical protein